MKPTKEIDWEERHFQLCLAILSCPVADTHGFASAPSAKKAIAKADEMVELLKKRHLEPAKETPDSENPEPATETAEKKKGFEGFGRSIAQNMRFQKIWTALQELGYTNGSDIPFFHFNECCENLNIDADSIDLAKFSDKFDVNIG